MTDRVDITCRQWAQQRPDLDTSFAGITLRVLVLARHIEYRAAAVLAEEGLQTWEFDVLSALRRTGEPYCLTPGALARSVMLTCGAMTHRIKRLESRGYVQRSPMPTDRRSIQVQLTDAGRARVDVAATRQADLAPRMLEGLTTAEQEALEALLREFLAGFEAPIDEAQ